jgi:hypothetical protein
MNDFEPNPKNVDGEMMCSEKCSWYRGEDLNPDCAICDTDQHCLPWYVQEYEKLKERVEELEEKILTEEFAEKVAKNFADKLLELNR